MMALGPGICSDDDVIVNGNYLIRVIHTGRYLVGVCQNRKPGKEYVRDIPYVNAFFIINGDVYDLENIAELAQIF